MLKVIRKNDRTAPIICCDVCSSWIDDVGFGAAVFSAPTTEGQTKAVLLVHKGACHDKAEAGIRASGVTSGWQELKRYLIDALHNGGLTLEVINEIRADQERFGEL